MNMDLNITKTNHSNKSPWNLILPVNASRNHFLPLLYSLAFSPADEGHLVKFLPKNLRVYFQSQFVVVVFFFF